MDNELLMAYAEIDYILSFIPQEYIAKIPLKLREKFNKEKDNSYKVNIVSNKKLREQKLLKKTKSILAVLKYNYWCESELEKEKLYSKFKENEINYQNKIREIYNPYNIFNKKDRNEAIKEAEETNLVIYDNRIWYQRVYEFINSLFKKIFKR